MIAFIPKRLFSSSKAIHTPICIIGGGTAGANIVGHLKYQKGVLKSNIRVFEPSAVHYYQPSFTMIGAGLFSPHKSVAPTRKLIDDAVAITEMKVSKILPESNMLVTEDGTSWSYEQLIICSGTQSTPAKIPGAVEALEDESIPVSTIYLWKYAQKTNRLVGELKKGTALFTEPCPPIKCAGAPQKIVFLSLDRWRRHRDHMDVHFYKPGDAAFGVPKYSEMLTKIHGEKNVGLHLCEELIEIRGKEQVAVFRHMKTKAITEKRFDFLHFTPPHVPPEFIKESGLADPAGYVDVDKHTFRHTKYANIWSCGDSSNIPTGKTAAAIMTQAPILIRNVLAAWRDKKADLPARYYGYTSCPIFVGGRKLLLAEFKYAGEIDETFPYLQNKPRSLFYYLKTKLFPFVYFRIMKRGLWLGRDGMGRVLY